MPIRLNADGSKTLTTGLESIADMNPTLNAGVATGDFVYYDTGNSRYDKVDLSTGGSGVGIGVVDSNDNVIKSGKIEGLSGLTAGEWYYADLTTLGTLITANTSKVRVLWAVSTTEGMIDIDVEGIAKSSDYPIPNPVNGYMGGGFVPAITTKVDKITFANSNVSVNTSTLTIVKAYSAGIGDMTTYGYFLSGSDNGGNPISTVDKITFADSTITVNTSSVSPARYHFSGMGDRTTYGYTGGGRTTSGGTKVSTVEKLTFDGGSISANASSLSGVRAYAAALGGTNNGYFLGGEDPVINTVDRLTFSNSNVSANVSNLTTAKARGAGISDITTYGYMGGGEVSNQDEVFRITFSNDNIASNASWLTGNARQNAGSGDGGVTYGYWGGGEAGPLDRVDRVIWSNSNVEVNTSTLTSTWNWITGIDNSL